MQLRKELRIGKTLDLFIHTDVYDHDGFSWPGPQNQVRGTIPANEWKILAHCSGTQHVCQPSKMVLKHYEFASLVSVTLNR